MSTGFLPYHACNLKMKRCFEKVIVVEERESSLPGFLPRRKAGIVKELAVTRQRL
jgi:hypothetical protein